VKIFFDGKVLDRKKLSGIVFGNSEKRRELSEILKVPALIGFENALREMSGIVMVDAAYFTEYGMLPLVNYNTILVGCDEGERYRRVLERDGMTRKEVEAKTKSQHSHELRRRKILDNQRKVDHGFFYEVDTTCEVDYGMILSELKENFYKVKRMEVAA